jgi:hypothetical protein
MAAIAQSGSKAASLKVAYCSLSVEGTASFEASNQQQGVAYDCRRSKDSAWAKEKPEVDRAGRSASSRLWQQVEDLRGAIKPIGDEAGAGAVHVTRITETLVRAGS